jgi:hypothetical protein
LWSVLREFSCFVQCLERWFVEAWASHVYFWNRDNNSPSASGSVITTTTTTSSQENGIASIIRDIDDLQVKVQQPTQQRPPPLLPEELSAGCHDPFIAKDPTRSYRIIA